MRARLKTVAGGLVALVVATGLTACGDDAPSAGEPGSTDPGVDVNTLSPVVDNGYVAFSSFERAEFEGTEFDEETGEGVATRVVTEPSTETATVGGTEVAVVVDTDYENGEVVERTQDYYAQTGTGDVYYMGEDVDDIEDGEVVGHHGAWQAGVDGARAGVFMPAAPEVGDEFEQERAPGVAEDRSTVLRTGLVVRVPAGTFDNCIKTKDVDPLGGGEVEFKFYCFGAGLVRERYPGGGSLELVRIDTRAQSAPGTRP
jgi:hypothetical protein